MKKYSGIYKFNGRSFRYDFEHSIVELVQKADKEMLKDNIEWREKYGRDLWELDEHGIHVVDGVGLNVKNWKSKMARDMYLSEWCADLDYEAECAIEELKYEFGF